MFHPRVVPIVAERLVWSVNGSAGIGQHLTWEREHAPGLVVCLARRVGPQLAEEIVADTFEAVVRQWTTYDAERGSPRVWLYGIATNLLRRHARTEQRSLTALSRLAGADGGTEPHDTRVAERVDADVRVRQLAGAPADLSQGDRDVLLLTAWVELDVTTDLDGLRAKVTGAADGGAGSGGSDRARRTDHRPRRWRADAPGCCSPRSPRR